MHREEDLDGPAVQCADKDARSRRRTLQNVLAEQYNYLKLRLTRRLGSQHLAEDALQSTWINVNGSHDIERIENPRAYLFRAAYHAALRQQRTENVFLSEEDVEALRHVADDAPGAARIFEGRADLERLKAVLARLPLRRREILLARRLDRLSLQEIAVRFGISVSMVKKELVTAQNFCVARYGWTKKTNK